MILCSNPRAQYTAHRAAIDAAIRRVLDSGWYILGEEVEAFEKEFARFTGVAHAVGVGNGTDAIEIALRSGGIGPGDEVITVSHTAVATVAAIEQTGATPVLIDVDPDYYTLDPRCLEAALTERTRAIVPVHLYGQPADMDAILSFARNHDLRVIEDGAQAHGAMLGGRRVGSLGNVGCFSFYPTKNLGALGDGGAIVTDDGEWAAKARRLREYGWVERYVSQVAGRNSRLDAIQAAVLRAKLPALDADNRRRMALAEIYDRALASAPAARPARRPGSTHVHHLYVIRSAFRDALQAHLRAKGIAALVHYPVPVHLQPAYRGRVAAASLAVTERLATEVLSLPLYPELTNAEADAVAAAVRSFAEGSP